LTALCKLAATCEFGTFEDEMLRDRIVTGLRNHGHREHLLRESTLTLQKAIDICRTNEMAASQRHKMEQLVLFTSLAKRRNVVHARIHEEVHVPRARANIAVTLMQPETATLMAKRVQNATRKIT